MGWFNKWIKFQSRQARLRRVIRNEQSTKKIMDWANLDYDDINLRIAVSTSIKEHEDQINSGGIN